MRSIVTNPYLFFKHFQNEKKILTLFSAVLFVAVAHSQVVEPVQLKYQIKRQGEDHAELIIKAKIDKGWLLYGQNFEDGGPIKMSIKFEPNKNYLIMGKVAEYPEPTKIHDEIFDIDVQYYTGWVTFIQDIHLNKLDTPLNIKMTLEGQACSEESGACVMVKGKFTFD